MKLAVGYSTKDSVELTEQTLPRLIQASSAHIYWCDGSDTQAGKDFIDAFHSNAGLRKFTVRGGADAAIAWKLSTMLASPERYDLIGLVESDVLLDDDWFWPTIDLFDKGKADGLHVGAVSPRSYIDRVLIQRDGYACMHNLGAGVVIFTREAAEIVLRTLRSGWWPDNVRLFAHLSGIDLRSVACFRGNEQWVTTDWTWEAQLAKHGLAALALTPAKCQMIGQNPPLEQQGLKLTADSGKWSDPGPWLDPDIAAFGQYVDALRDLKEGHLEVERPQPVYRDGASMLFFPHQIGFLGGALWQGTLELRWSQGFGPFAYRAGPGGATLSVPISGPGSYLVTGGAAGARVTIEDHRSGFKAQPNLPPESGEPVTVTVPGGPVPRLVTMKLDEGAVFYGLLCSEPQLIDNTFEFEWSQLPRAK